ncbi:MAG: signal peptidase I [Bacilli bacterium]|nr:signal peptidase I [Bacilli bacterium]
MEENKESIEVLDLLEEEPKEETPVVEEVPKAEVSTSVEVPIPAEPVIEEVPKPVDVPEPEEPIIEKVHTPVEIPEPSESKTEEIPKPEEKKEESKNKGLGRKILKKLLRMLLKVLVVALILGVTFTIIFGFHLQKGLSMYPKFVDHDLLLYYKLEKNFRTGDVVIVRNNGRDYALRIVAIENDIVEIDDENLKINGHIVEEDIYYVTPKKKKLNYPYTVPRGSVFVLGDYRTHSKDSRDFGAISFDNVKGKVINVLRNRDI